MVSSRVEQNSRFTLPRCKVGLSTTHVPSMRMRISKSLAGDPHESFLQRNDWSTETGASPLIWMLSLRSGSNVVSSGCRTRRNWTNGDNFIEVMRMWFISNGLHEQRLKMLYEAHLKVFNGCGWCRWPEPPRLLFRFTIRAYLSPLV